MHCHWFLFDLYESLTEMIFFRLNHQQRTKSLPIVSNTIRYHYIVVGWYYYYRCYLFSIITILTYDHSECRRPQCGWWWWVAFRRIACLPLGSLYYIGRFALIDKGSCILFKWILFLLSLYVPLGDHSAWSTLTVVVDIVDVVAMEHQQKL